ncbi:MAG TPA: histidine triad nucleotide-binding protein [Myxococcota bacterium]|nr:histidine triad nucleotide-binding protein [Myxococcota bacterium]
MSDCIFCKIRDGSIPATIVHRDEICLAFEDVDPAAPRHIVIIPSEHIATLNDITAKNAETIGHIFMIAAELAVRLNIADSGYRIVTNCNADGGQEVFHVHFHLIGGRKLAWPPG